MARRRGGAAAAVVGAVSVMALVYYSTVFVFLDHWLGLGNAAGAAHAAAFSLVVNACFFSFLSSTAADPGSMPASFAPDAEEPQRQGLKSRYCDKCCRYKPSRTHNCKDHHCVWINNCVGYANYKFFIIYVLNATIGSLCSLVVFLFDLFQTEHEYDVPDVKVVRVLYYAGISISCHNMTTIEYREATRAKWLAQKSGQKYQHRFDLGTRKNIQTIMGPYILCWLCPTATGHLKDGTEFQITNN